MSSVTRWIFFFTPAAVVLILAASCGRDAAATDIRYNSSGPLPGLAYAVTILSALALAGVIGLIALIAALLAKGDGRAAALSVLLAAVMIPVGVAGGNSLGRSTITPLPPAPPVPTPMRGRMTIDIDAPVSVHVEATAHCQRRGSGLVLTKRNYSEWETRWLGERAVLGPQVDIDPGPDGDLTVHRVTLEVERFDSNSLIYFHDGTLDPSASSMDPDGHSGEVRFSLEQRPHVPLEATPYPDQPATITGSITWSCAGA